VRRRPRSIDASIASRREQPRADLAGLAIDPSFASATNASLRPPAARQAPISASADAS
jgi:hypothetical protein